jgi:hypothetical protein
MGAIGRIQDSSFNNSRRNTKMAGQKLVVEGSSGVTASQLKDLFRQIEDGGIGHDELQAVLERRDPFLNKFREALVACCFNCVSHGIEERFKLEPMYRPLVVFAYNTQISSDEAVKRIRRENIGLRYVKWHRANFSELLVYAQGPWNGEDYIVALGSETKNQHTTFVPVIFGHKGNRELRIFPRHHDWPKHAGFLAALE